ncbi:MAG: hypothetical protein K1Y36_04760 [Blastocatellia bacterium]|nr:hypothetical protein [Blastocatellia bacterium]
MSQINQQVHGKFKVFAGKLEADRTIGPLAGEIAKFAADAKIAAKSIGVEYLESAQRLIITIGYRDDEPGYPVAVHCTSLGTVTDVDTNDFSKLEQAMADAAAQIHNIICHELYVTEDHEFLMVFLTHAA